MFILSNLLNKNVEFFTFSLSFKSNWYLWLENTFRFQCAGTGVHVIWISIAKPAHANVHWSANCQPPWTRDSANAGEVSAYPQCYFDINFGQHYNIQTLIQWIISTTYLFFQIHAHQIRKWLVINAFQKWLFAPKVKLCSEASADQVYLDALFSKNYPSSSNRSFSRILSERLC